MNAFENKTFSETYVSLLNGLMTKGAEKSPRGQKVKYFQNCLFIVNKPGDVFSSPSRKYNWDYLNKELKLYFSGDMKGSSFGEASKFWLKLTNPDGTINSNYGNLIFYKPIDNKYEHIKNQWTYAKRQLLADKDTRQALMFISSPHVQYEGNKDFICTLNYTFNINDDVLSMTVNRRSQDVILGIVYDYAWEALLLLKMYNELKPIYPTLKLGSYTMFCNNIHVYERNWDVVNKMLNDCKEGNGMAEMIMNHVDKSIITSYVLNKEFGN